MTTQEKIEKILTREFFPVHLEVRNDSLSHAGHKEAVVSGGGHYSVMIVSSAFAGKKTIDRHRKIHQALKRELKEEIHALAIKAYSPQEKGL